MALKTDYKDDIIDSSVNVNRTFSIIDNTTGQTIYPNVSLEETTVFSQEGDSHTAQITNEQNTEINQIITSLSNIVPQALINNRLFGVGIDVLDGSLDNNRLYLVGIAQSTNCPPQATRGMGLRMMYYTGDNYWTNIVYFYHLDGGQMYFNVYHKATGAWQGWKLVGGNMRPDFSVLLANFANGATVTIDRDSFLVGTVGNYALVTINGYQIVKTRDETVSLCLPVKANDKILVSNWAGQDTDIALHVFGVLN